MTTLKKSFYTTLLIATAGLYITTAKATPSIRHTEDFYTIQGSSVSELVRQMSDRGPWRNDGNTYYASTDWDVNWHYQYHFEDNSCSFHPMNVTVNIQYLYPKWTNKISAPFELQHKWDRFIDALTKHEHGHAAFATKSANGIESLIRAAHGPDCPSLSQIVEAKANAILNNALQAEIEYDKTTNHGIATGAFLD